MPVRQEPTATPAARRFKPLAAAAVAVWLLIAFWHSVKPLPPGVHTASLVARLTESQVEFFGDGEQQASLLQRQLNAVDHAEQLIIVDQTPLSRELAQHVLNRRRQRPAIKIVVATDPAPHALGGTPEAYLAQLEQFGIIVVRTRLERLRDCNPLYGSLWRIVLGWWSRPYDEDAEHGSLRALLRQQNFKANERQLLIVDDGAGSWLTVLSSAAAGSAAGASNLGVLLKGRLARELGASEIRIARWSSDDDRLPAELPVESRGAGTIDGRVLTEGATRAALAEALGAATAGDAIDIAARTVSDRSIIASLERAAERGANLRLLLDPGAAPNPVVAAELARAAPGRISIRWLPRRRAQDHFKLTFVRHRSDAWLYAGSADLTRRALDDFNLEANVELRMPARTAVARSALGFFEREWSRALPYEQFADLSQPAYWRYRVAEASGLTSY